MKHQVGQKFKGIYKPSVLNWLIFFISSIVPTILFSFLFGETVSGAIKAFPFVFLIAGTISSEINLRTVTINEGFISSCGPLKLYQQKIQTEEIEGIRRLGDHPVEVMHNGKAIVFASNRSFKKKLSEHM
jgi:hypothetical protein